MRIRVTCFDSIRSFQGTIKEGEWEDLPQMLLNEGCFMAGPTQDRRTDPEAIDFVVLDFDRIPADVFLDLKTGHNQQAIDMAIHSVRPGSDYLGPFPVYPWSPYRCWLYLTKSDMHTRPDRRSCRLLVAMSRPLTYQEYRYSLGPQLLHDWPGCDPQSLDPRRVWFPPQGFNMDGWLPIEGVPIDVDRWCPKITSTLGVAL